MTLAELAQGDRARIAFVGGGGGFRRRLLELGLVEGTEVERTGQSPMGDPLSFRVRGAVLCLHRVQADEIRVDPMIAAS